MAGLHSFDGRVWSRLEQQLLSLAIAALASLFLVTPSGQDGGTLASITTDGRRVLSATPSAAERDDPQEVAAWVAPTQDEQIQPQEQSPPTTDVTGSGDESSPLMPASAPTPEAEMDEVNQYLWTVYQRSPTKRDGSGDFTWKDAAAAARLGLSPADYVIRGMDRDFRELLYRAGLAMDAAGFRWTILSAFRDDYRQGLASGYKARASYTLHGGSATTGGYRHGCAVDIKDADEDTLDLWSWLDAHRAQLGLERPLAWIDPDHVQPHGPWHEVAAVLRKHRLAKEASPEAGDVDAQLVNIGTVQPSAADMLCIGLHHHHYEASETRTSPSGEARTFKSAARAHHLGRIEREKAHSRSVAHFQARSSEGSRSAAGGESVGPRSARLLSTAKTSRPLARHALPGVSHRGGTT
jgi:hypothetical protein